MISRIISVAKLVVFGVLNKCIHRKIEISSNSILLIRLDAIGDYVLFRNFIEIISKSNKYKDYKITLLGNIEWRSLSEELDSKYVNRFIWLDRKKFINSLIYRHKKLKQLTSQGYELLISPCHSREFNFGDNIAKLVSAREKIGSIGDLSSIRAWQKRISDRYYTKLIPAKDDIVFEYWRNKEFFEGLLEIKIDLKQPIIKLRPRQLKFELPVKYGILFIGASCQRRKWSIKKFARVAEHIQQKYNLSIVLCGGPADVEDAKQFAQDFQNDFIDLVGRTSLPDLLQIIYYGKLMIANETSAPHFAIALEMANVFVISNGNHFGRFTPYPKEISDAYHAVYHPEIEKYSHDFKQLSNCYGNGSALNIKEISVESVTGKIDEVLNERNL
jgi:ADP-heptose:LPS heptosyltransferase